jgi:hypothetical protein
MRFPIACVRVHVAEDSEPSRATVVELCEGCDETIAFAWR